MNLWALNLFVHSIHHNLCLFNPNLSTALLCLTIVYLISILVWNARQQNHRRRESINSLCEGILPDFFYISYQYSTSYAWYLGFWQTLIRSPKSKSNSRLTTGFSLKTDCPTTHPATPPPPPTGKVSKKQDTAIYPKQKLLVYIRRLCNMFLNRPRLKTIHWESRLTKNLQSKNSLTMQNRAIYTNWKQTYFSSWRWSFSFQF